MEYEQTLRAFILAVFLVKSVCTAVWGLKRLPCGGHFTHWRSQTQRNKGRSQELLGRFLEGVTRKQTSKMGIVKSGMVI